MNNNDFIDLFYAHVLQPFNVKWMLDDKLR